MFPLTINTSKGPVKFRQVGEPIVGVPVPFKAALIANIHSYIKSAKRQGTTSVSVENLLQCVKSPSSTLQGAPHGTNAKYWYDQMFREACAGDYTIKQFTTF